MKFQIISESFSALFLNLNLLIVQVSSDLAALANGFTPHLHLQLISNTVEKENLLPFASSYYASVLNNVMFSSLFNSSVEFKRERSLKMIISLNSTAETLRVLNQIGTFPDVKSSEVRPYILLLWPEEISSEVNAISILNSEPFKAASKGFTIASHLLIAFKRNVTNKVTTDDDYILYEAFNINSLHIVDSVESGVIDFRCFNCQGRAVRRSNFHGLTLNVVGIEDKELNDDLHYEKGPNGELVFSPEGFSAKILQILQKSLNFSVKAMKSDEWGRINPETNSWVGAIKEVMDGNADLAIAVTIMRPNRASVVSFLPAADEHIISGFFRTPELNAIRDIFARPFKPDLWAAVFSTWLVLAFFMILFSVIRKRYDLQNSKDGVEEPDFTQDSFIWALATACQQGWDEHPKAGSLRTIFISGSFTGVVAYAGYSAAIVSTLSLRIDPIQNPDQLLRSRLNLGIRTGFISELLQQNNTKDIMTEYQNKLKNTKPEEQYLNIADGYQTVLHQPYAFISTKDNFYDNLKVTTGDTEICALKELQILKHGFPIGHFVPFWSPYKEFLRYMYVTIREPGISWKLRGNYSYTRRCLEASDNSSGQALGANDVFTAFMILSAGYLLSVTFLIIEKLFRVSATFSYIR